MVQRISFTWLQSISLLRFQLKMGCQSLVVNLVFQLIELICIWQIVALDPEMFPKTVSFFHSFCFTGILIFQENMGNYAANYLQLCSAFESGTKTTITSEKLYIKTETVWELYSWKWGQRSKEIQMSTVTFWSPM